MWVNPMAIASYQSEGLKPARSIWSTCNNSVMELFSVISNDETLYSNYIHEKQNYIELLAERAEILIRECKQQGIAIYPFSEGFFVTLKVPNNEEKVALNQRLQEINIFTVEVDGGLRIALCSVPKRKLRGLAQKIKSVM